MVSVKWDFLGLVLLAWAISWLTLVTNGWQFILGNNNWIGVRLGSIIAVILTLVAFWLSLLHPSEPLVVRAIAWVLGTILIGLLSLWFYLIESGV